MGIVLVHEARSSPVQPEKDKDGFQKKLLHLFKIAINKEVREKLSLLSDIYQINKILLSGKEDKIDTTFITKLGKFYFRVWAEIVSITWPSSPFLAGRPCGRPPRKRPT